MPNAQTSDRKRLEKGAADLNNALRAEVTGKALRFKRELYLGKGNCDGWGVTIATMGPGLPDLEIWLDRINGGIERHFWFGFAALKLTPVAMAIDAYHLPRGSREIGDIDLVKAKGIYSLRRPLSKTEAKQPICELYDCGLSYFGHYDLTANPGNANLNIERAVGFLAPLARSLLGSAGGGWRSIPDAAHNAKVEAAAIMYVREKLKETFKKDRQRENCGWDLEFLVDGRTLCVEVKGLAGDKICVELTPNEYSAMKRAMHDRFSEGDYRLAVVCNALSRSPRFYLFKYKENTSWRCERSQQRITASERIAARLE